MLLVTFLRPKLYGVSFCWVKDQIREFFSNTFFHLIKYRAQALI